MPTPNEQEEFEFRLRAEREAQQQPETQQQIIQPTQIAPKKTLLERFKASTQPMSWSDVPGQAISNLPGSVANIAKGVYGAVTSPLETAKGVLDVAAGGLQNILPESLVQAVGEDRPSREKAAAVGEFYKGRYGSEEGLKRALSTDPAGVAADLATVLTGGGGLAAKVPMLGGAGRAAIKAGTTIDPLAATLRGAGGLVDVGKGAAKNILGMTTGAGGEAIGQAYKAGKKGGLTQESFIENMRGAVPKEQVLDSIDANIQAMGKAKSEAYRAGMEQLGKEQKPLDMSNINKAAQDAMKISTFTGRTTGKTVSTATSTLPMQDKIATLINDWNKLDPTDFHTAEGLDALKKSIGDLRDSTQYGTPERLVADKVYHAVKNQIVKQAPDYAKTMKDYQQASDLISEIRSTLSNKPNASVDTQVRKLQSLMRNNVATNYGNRLDLVRQLEQQGGSEILPAVAGQALSSLTPRGLQSATTIPTAIGVGKSNPLLGAATLGLGSPRLMGEAALKAGQGARIAGAPVTGANRLAEMAGVNPTIAANYLYQLSQQNK